MGDARLTAAWFTDGWAEAYHRRAKGFGPKIPADQHKRMVYALKRMYTSQRREDEPRVAIGKKRIWFAETEAA